MHKWHKGSVCLRGISNLAAVVKLLHSTLIFPSKWKRMLLVKGYLNAFSKAARSCDLWLKGKCISYEIGIPVLWAEMFGYSMTFIFVNGNWLEINRINHVERKGKKDAVKGMKLFSIPARNKSRLDNTWKCVRDITDELESYWKLLKVPSYLCVSTVVWGNSLEYATNHQCHSGWELRIQKRLRRIFPNTLGGTRRDYFLYRGNQVLFFPQCSLSWRMAYVTGRFVKQPSEYTSNFF